MKILSGLTNGQVLQRLGSRGATVRIEGTSAENSAVLATISQAGREVKGWEKKTVGKASAGKFSVWLKGIPAGGPYRLRLEIGKKLEEISSFFVGDVWVLAGQSNMEGVGNITGAAKSHPLIRALSMRREWRLATDPLHVLPESPDICHHGGAPYSPAEAEKRRKEGLKGTGVGIFFARELLKRSGVPQGLICTAHGGTSMEQWSPERKHLGGESLYASMLESVRVTGQPVAGVLWYQGESDANEQAALLYTERMKKLVAATRRDFGHAKLPWIIVQIGRFFSAASDATWWNNIQEQQRVLPDKIKYLETVPSIDLPMDDQIHIGAAGFVDLGERMARAADLMVYGNAMEKRPPSLRMIRRLERRRNTWATRIEVTFDRVVGELKSCGEPDGFVLVKSSGEGIPVIYKTTLQGNKIQLEVQGGVPADASISYGHGFVPHCNITDGRGFPLPVFGPCKIDGIRTVEFLPFVTEWKMAEIVPTPLSLDKVPCPDVDGLNPVVKKYGAQGFNFGMEGFINERPIWQHKGGHAYFESQIHLEEPMKLLVLMGYDGPFRLWLDGKPFFTDIKGVNPCLPDKSQKMAELKKGRHDLTVGMDLNGGQAWGFFLRFRRKDVSAAELRAKDFVKPTYSV